VRAGETADHPTPARTQCTRRKTPHRTGPRGLALSTLAPKEINARSTAASERGCTDDPTPTRRHTLPHAGEYQYSLSLPPRLTRVGIQSPRRLAQRSRRVVLSPTCAAELPAPLPCTSSVKRGPRGGKRVKVLSGCNRFKYACTRALKAPRSIERRKTLHRSCVGRGKGACFSKKNVNIRSGREEVED